MEELTIGGNIYCENIRNPEYDVIIAPSNLGIKLAVAGKSQYKIDKKI